MVQIDEVQDDRHQIVEFTLTDRKDMESPVLIGRITLDKKFLIDVSLTNVNFNKHFKK